ncbi:ATP-dependent DNA helicase RecG [Pseudoflavonifractor phocaeensis]|uniref:ATP-dependent DNA helicase RecG n=1 Tax=Pseudoflavonifractor phocaeensis TaxID=1870988 RepID=UPI001F1D0DFC|nr:ATP-dependent DNA helicase RecG [Pseudoflavonifractor phocaeensis]MCF2661945.1 ATP-dependent DNA helicase RecG [Pseudoflavonifractor phocaeensis]
MAVTLGTPMTQFSGVGEVRAKKLEKLGLSTAADLLAYYPRDYEDRRQMYTIRDAPLEGRVCITAMAAEHPRLARIRKGLELVQLKVVDHTGALHLTFFNQGYVEKALRAGEEYIFFGTVEEQGRRRTMVNPIFERVGKQNFTGCIMPIYPLTAGITNHLLTSLTRQALDCAACVPETLPQSVRQAHNLAELEFSIRNIHFPENDEALTLARERLTFEELFYLAVGLDFLKRRREAAGPGCAIPTPPFKTFRSLLPFEPTGAQKRVMDEVAFDMASGRPMNRLVQGDVGSGKTAVAAYAAWLAAQGGYQAALMAPTEVLAEQHYRSLSALLSPAGVRVGLLTGALPPAEKKKVRQALAHGDIDFIIGTHALISDGVVFRRLALIVADEQHRFGVAQRAALAAKSTTPGAPPQVGRRASGEGRKNSLLPTTNQISPGEPTAAKSETGGMPAPHVLVMSATPIPRTLALIVYGDLDVSVIDQLPPGRTPVETYVIREDKRARMYNFVRKQVSEGRQVYLVCPAVEENPGAALPGEEVPSLDLKAVKTYAAKLQKEVFPDLTVGILHGKMRPKEKEAVMAAFAAGEIQVLVATTVIEVGVDVPNASLMVIENADHFGLSQLHQLRGRVGRGKHQSYCVLVTSTKNPDSMARLRTLASTTDGFKISEEDLKLRGPGDFFGSRQHGLPQMKLADLAGDMRLLSQAQEAARRLLREDPGLSRPEDRPVLDRVRRLFSDTPDIFN